MEFYSLVVKRGNDSCPELSGNSTCEPSLLPENKALLPRFSVPMWNVAYAEHLQRRIERNPRDLRAHTQRVLMSMAQRAPLAIFSALADLFIVLGKSGHALRHSLLTQVAEAMEAEQFQFLKQRLRSGLCADEQLPGGSYSSLSQGGSENFPLVTQANGQRRTLSDSGLGLARQYIVDGEPGRACELLESILSCDPGNSAMCLELLAFYREYNLVDAFQHAYYRLSGRALAEPQCWRELDDYFRHNANNSH